MMGNGKCINCDGYSQLNGQNVPICFDCDDFNTSQYVKNLIKAVEDGLIDNESDIISEYEKLSRSSNKGTRKKLSEEYTFLEKIAVKMTNVVGTMWFFFFCIILVTIPLIWPQVMPAIQYISSGYLQLILLPLILMGQELLGRASDRRAENSYEQTIKSDIEINLVKYKLNKLIKMLEKDKTS